VNVESVRLPLPDYFEAAQRRYTDAASEVKYVTCEGVNGSIFYYRFASIGARVRAAAAYPDLHRRLLSCVNGTEVLIDNLIFSQTRTAKYCRRLHFQVERPRARR
jgi:hypothetical protein